jgi:hypothetical protein
MSGCAEGGDEDRPQSEVTLRADHHLFGFRTARGFGAFPVTAADVAGTTIDSVRRELRLFQDANYQRVEFPGGGEDIASDSYALTTRGELSLLVTGGGSEPTVVFRGAYSRVADPDTEPVDFFYTDRVSTPASPTIGLFYGTRVVAGAVELAGDYHLLSLHLILNGDSAASFDGVGRGAFGNVTVGAGAAGALRSLDGSGTQRNSAVSFNGSSIRNLLGDGRDNGRCIVTVRYDVTGEPPDDREMLAAASNNTVMALDADEEDGEVGMLMLVRKFASNAQTSQMRGTFLVGGHTLFVDQSNSGSDTFVGTVTLGEGNFFRLDGVSNTGADFAYTGTWTANTEGRLTINIPSSGSSSAQEWSAAIDRSYNTLVIIDAIPEQRSNSTIRELNFVVGVRRNG